MAGSRPRSRLFPPAPPPALPLPARPGPAQPGPGAFNPWRQSPAVAAAPAPAGIRRLKAEGGDGKFAADTATGAN